MKLISKNGVKIKEKSIPKVETKPKQKIMSKITNKMNRMREDSEKANKINKLINDWKDIMYEIGLKTESNDILSLFNIEKKEYGFKCSVYAPRGINIYDLEKAKPFIETGIGCIFLFTIKQKGDQIAGVKFVTEGFGGNNILYEPPKISAFELYLGNSIEGKPVIISIQDVCHFLLSGSNGGGKSRMLDCMLTTLIHNCDETELELYLAQISKNDLVVYEDALCCRAFCETLDQVETMLTHIIEKMKQRDKLIRPMRKDFLGSDISAYNKIYPHKKLSICWLIFDEVASIMNKTGNDGETKKQKDRIVAMMEEIARVGRALGIFLGVCLQRPKAESLSPDVKAQANLRISFSQNNIKSSEVAMDDSDIAVGLDQRVAVYSCRGGGFDFVKTPYIDDKLIEKYIKSKSKRGHRNLFSDLEKLNKTNIKANQPPEGEDTDENIIEKTQKGTAPLPKKATPIKKEEIKNITETKSKPNIKPIDISEPTTKTTENLLNPKIEIPKIKVITPILPSTPLEFNNVDPVKIVIDEQKLSENIKNINDFVPYDPNFKPKIIIDQTKFNLNTQKPIRVSKGESE